MANEGFVFSRWSGRIALLAVFVLLGIGLASAPWDWHSIPLAHCRRGWPRLVPGLFAAGAALVIVLWVGFLIDYPATYEAYFTLAIVHVLAEVPFLIQLR